MKSVIDQILIVLSADEVATTWSTVENATDQIPLLWPLKTPICCPSREFQSFAVLSCEPVTNNLSFGETAMELISFSWAILVYFTVTLWGSSFCDSNFLVNV